MAFDLSKLSTTPASNDQANYFQTGMRPSAVKTAGWNIGSIVAQLFNALPTGGGTANAQTLANPVVLTTLTTGLTCIYLPAAANTGAATFAPDGLTAKNIFYNGAALVGGELSTTVPAILKYDGTQWNLLVSAAASFLQTLPTGAGTANAQTVTNATGFKWTALVTGERISFIPGVANTGATTLAVDGLTAKNVFNLGAALVGGELTTTIPVTAIYDGTQFNLVNTSIDVSGVTAQSNKYTYYADTGAVNALVITAAPAISAYANGQSFLVKVANTTTNSTPTININSLGAKNLYYPDGTTQILAGSLILNNIYRMTYDSSLNAAAGGLIVESPSIITGTFTLTLTGFTSNPTGTVTYHIGNDGKGVDITSVTINGASNATTMTGTGVPAILNAATDNMVFVGLENNNLGGWGTISALSTSTWSFTFNALGNGAGWTASNSKGIIGGYQFHYSKF